MNAYFNRSRDGGDSGGGKIATGRQMRPRQPWVLEDDTTAHRNMRDGSGEGVSRGGMRGSNRGTKRGDKSAAIGGGYERGRGRGSKHSGRL
jgi:hypothetical protein